MIRSCCGSAHDHHKKKKKEYDGRGRPGDITCDTYAVNQHTHQHYFLPTMAACEYLGDIFEKQNRAHAVLQKPAVVLYFSAANYTVLYCCHVSYRGSFYGGSPPSSLFLAFTAGLDTAPDPFFPIVWGLWPPV